MVEIVFTALLVCVVLSTTSGRFSPGIGGLVVGFTLTLIHLVTIPVDNTSVNPARSLATAIFADTDPERARSALGVHHLPAGRLGRRRASCSCSSTTRSSRTRCSTPARCAAARATATKAGNKAVGAIDDTVRPTTADQPHGSVCFMRASLRLKQTVRRVGRCADASEPGRMARARSMIRVEIGCRVDSEVHVAAAAACRRLPSPACRR